MFSGKPIPESSTGPVPFGPKMAWLAVKSESLETVTAFLELEEQRKVSWKVGIGTVYDFDNKHLVFVTPMIRGWVFVVGFAAVAIADAHPNKSLYNSLDLLSERFGEAQGFATHRVSEYHLWMSAKDGKVLRSFEFAGDIGELSDNFGPLTEVERTLAFFGLPKEEWSAGEGDVMKVAGAWSLDPTTLTEGSGSAELGVIGRIGLEIE